MSKLKPLLPLVIIRQIMRLECKTITAPRGGTPGPFGLTSSIDRKRYVQSTLAVCKVPKSDTYSLIHFTNANKPGTKYNINKENVKSFLTRFACSGKVTLQLNQPEIDIFIDAERESLRRFCVLIANILKGNLELGDQRCISSMSVGGVKQKVKKLVIENRSQWPSKGFPRSLEQLQLHGLNSSTLSRSILQLSQLRSLDLSGNKLEVIPKQLNQLAFLSELNLSNNYLFESRPKHWNWMSGCLSKSLNLLDLSKNQLGYVPKQIVRLHNLVTLKVNENKLESLPDNFGLLRNLMYLNVSYNNIERLPGSMRISHLLSLDSHENSFDVSRIPPIATLPVLPICSLLECAAKQVLRSKQRYSSETIPFNLVDYLDFAKFCVCGTACFEVFATGRERLKLNEIANECIGKLYCNVDVPYCSSRCFRSSYQYRCRNRNPVI